MVEFITGRNSGDYSENRVKILQIPRWLSRLQYPPIWAWLPSSHYIWWLDSKPALYVRVGLR